MQYLKSLGNYYQAGSFNPPQVAMCQAQQSHQYVHRMSTGSLPERPFDRQPPVVQVASCKMRFDRQPSLTNMAGDLKGLSVLASAPVGMTTRGSSGTRAVTAPGSPSFMPPTTVPEREVLKVLGPTPRAFCEGQCLPTSLTVHSNENVSPNNGQLPWLMEGKRGDVH